VGGRDRAAVVALALLCLAAVLLIPLELWVPGILAWLASAVLIWRSGNSTVQRRLGVLLGCIAGLAVAPIHTETSNQHFLVLGSFFLAAVAVPALILGRTDPGVIRYRLWPGRLRWRDLVPVALSVPLAWAGLRLYFLLSPEITTNWYLPPEPDTESLLRLFVGINGVGIWDELFFVNTSFAIIRSLFPFPIANLAQAVIYTAVLNEMAFTGVGPVFVYSFALIQATMFEKTENLLYVVVVHLVVDYFLFQEIVTHYYPGFTAWWHP
jgi:hypothetical protein